MAQLVFGSFWKASLPPGTITSATGSALRWSSLAQANRAFLLNAKMKRLHAVITGASQGLGLVIAQRLLGESWKVSLLSRKKVSGIEPSLKKSAIWIKTDARLPHSLRRSAKEAAAFGGSINLWINNVGISAWRPLKKIDENFWNEMVETNLKSTLFGCQVALSYMQKGA